MLRAWTGRFTVWATRSKRCESFESARLSQGGDRRLEPGKRRPWNGHPGPQPLAQAPIPLVVEEGSELRAVAGATGSFSVATASRHGRNHRQHQENAAGSSHHVAPSPATSSREKSAPPLSSSKIF